MPLSVTVSEIAAYWSKIASPLVFGAPGDAVRFTQEALVTKKLE